MDRPNILLMYTDQQRWDALGANGNADIRTPNLDALAAEGACFGRFFVQCPVCMPSRMSMLTGRYPAGVGVTSNGPPLPADAVTLPRLLRNYGYLSANIGKLHFLPHANRDHREIHPAYGFDHLEISDEPGCYEDAYRAWVRRKAPDQLDLVSAGLPPATKVWQETVGVRDGIAHPAERFPKRPVAFRGRSDLTHSAFVAEQTMAFVRARSREGRPWLCIAGFYSPHSPWVAPREFIDLYDRDKLAVPSFPEELQQERIERGFDDEQLRGARQGYYAMVSEVDHHVGRILRCLDETGQAGRTIVLFTSDHGEWLGEHLRWGKGYPGYDGSARVPLVVRWAPGGAADGRSIDDLTEAVDVVPTLLNWCGAPVPYELQGQPLPIADADPPARDSALIEGTGYVSLRTDDFLYVLRGREQEHLYDLTQPHGEYRDVSAEPARAAALSDHRGRLARRLLTRQRPLRPTWPY